MPWKLLGEAWKWNIFCDMRHKSHQSYSRDGIIFDRMEWKTFSITVEREEKEKRSSQSHFDVEETWRLAAERKRRWWMGKFSNFKWYLPRDIKLPPSVSANRWNSHFDPFFCVRERKSLIKFPLIGDGIITTTTESTIREKRQRKRLQKSFLKNFDSMSRAMAVWRGNECFRHRRCHRAAQAKLTQPGNLILEIVWWQNGWLGDFSLIKMLNRKGFRGFTLKWKLAFVWCAFLAGGEETRELCELREQ